MLSFFRDLFAREPIASPKSRAWHAFAAALAILLGSFISYIQFNSYPILSSATLLAIGLALIFGLVAGGLSYLSNKLMILSALVLGYLGAELYGLFWTFFGASFLGSLVALKNVKGLGFAAVMSAFIGLSSPFRMQPPPISQVRMAEGRTDLQPIVHIILDEVGPVELTDLGYSVWPNAHSKTHNTRTSIPQITGGYEDLLIEKGYSVEIWRSDHTNLCSRPCNEYRVHSLDVVEGMEQSDLIVLATFIGQALGNTTPYHHFALPSKRALQMVIDRSAELRPGEAVILHTILPHTPFILDPDCDTKPIDEWRHSQDRIGVDEAYREQVECVKKMIATIPADALVIVHGDHGHRRTDGPLEDDPKAAFNTLFAVRDGKREIHYEDAQVRDLLFNYVESLPSAN